ncbi:MAG: DNA repair exonuclease [Hyphomicrobiaceae bacterium]|nr:DNA repair exonuclease [Hyphomicrobiaceae bacterium]
MSLSFLHTADWHIGKPFRKFPERLAGRLDAARLEAIDTIARLARERGAGHVLVAGDVFDRDDLPPLNRRQAVERLARAPHVTWWLLPGNHDPARPKGLWSRLAADGLPANIRVVDRAEPVHFAPGVVLLPAPLAMRAAADDPTRWFDAATTAPDAVRIGLAHGSIKAFGSAGDPSAVIDPARARSAGLAYLALGDWHGTLRVDDRTWFSGTPEPDRFLDNDPGNVLHVTIAGPAAPPVVEKVPTRQFIWHRIERDIFETDALAAIERSLETLADDPARVLLELVLGGRLPLAEVAAVQRWRERLEARLMHLEADLSGLGVAAESAIGALADAGGEVLATARVLEAAASGAADAESRRVAELALLRLLSFVDDARGRTA